MSPEKRVLGFFRDESLAVEAIGAMSGSRWRLIDVHSPIPSEQILKALKTRKSKVGYFTLAGGIIGFLTGMGLAIYTSLQWSLIVSGKPVVSLIPFFIVGFEFTILFAVFGNVLGLLMQTNLPEFQSIKTYDPRCSGGYFGILASCPEGQQDALAAFFKERGGEVQLV
jgi:hypothetical protein